MNKKLKFIIKDSILILISIAIAIFLNETRILLKLLDHTKEFQILGSFISGIFFTSIFTTAPAIVVLSEISQVNSIFLTALIGALGAVTGDFLIFKFVRDSLSVHINLLLANKGGLKRFKTLFKHKGARWITFIVGGLILASPLPDELGISLMGLSKEKTGIFLLFSFIFNFIGILVIGYISNTL